MAITWPPEPPSNETRKVVVPSGEVGLGFVQTARLSSHLSPHHGVPPRIDRIKAASPLQADVSVGEYVLEASCGSSTWRWDENRRRHGEGGGEQEEEKEELSTFLARHNDVGGRILTVARGVAGMEVTKEVLTKLPNANVRSQGTSVKNPYLGRSQLDEMVGRARPGDWCKVEYHAYVAKPKRGKKTGDETEDLVCFATTRERPAKHFQIHPSLGQPDYEDKFDASKLPLDVPRGLTEGAALMSLGETCRIRISPEHGFGSSGKEAPQYKMSFKDQAVLEMNIESGAALDQMRGRYPNVLPHSTLVYDVTLMRICRDNKWHYRKAPPMNASSATNEIANWCCHNCLIM